MSGTRPWTRPRVLIGAAVVVVVIVVVAVGAWRLRGGGETAKPAHPRAQATVSPRSTIAGPKAPAVLPAMIMGNAKAPVLIEEFADYRCAACGAFSRQTAPALIKKYVNAGVVRIAWRDLPENGAQSESAAIAGRAAARQGKFWQFNTAVFALKPTEKDQKLTAAALRGAAKSAGLDLERYDADVKDPALRTAVEQDRAFGDALSMSGPPTFLINGEEIDGDQPPATFEKAIDQARKG